LKQGGKFDEDDFSSIDQTYKIFGFNTGIRKLQEE